MFNLTDFAYLSAMVSSLFKWVSETKKLSIRWIKLLYSTVGSGWEGRLGAGKDESVHMKEDLGLQGQIPRTRKPWVAKPVHLETLLWRTAAKPESIQKYFCGGQQQQDSGLQSPRVVTVILSLWEWIIIGWWIHQSSMDLWERTCVWMENLGILRNKSWSPLSYPCI